MSTGHPLVRTEWLKLLDPQRPPNAQLAALAVTPEDPGEDALSRIRTIREESKDLDLVFACIEALPGDRSPNPYEELEEMDQTRLFHRALHLSPEGCRRLWRMIFLDRMSYAQIGHRLKIPPGTVKSRVARARAKLKEALSRAKEGRS